MSLEALLKNLGYAGSPHFLRRDNPLFATIPDFGHIFRRAPRLSKNCQCQLEGVYALRQPDATPERIVPVVYVCSAPTQAAADALHRTVWNQDVVPFVLVHTREGVRVYSGFCFNQRAKRAEQRGHLCALTSFNALEEIVALFESDSVDSGSLWRKLGDKVMPQQRVYWKLLNSLKNLDLWLRKHGGLEKEISHALIGKYVYLHYLKARNILSPRKLDGWKIPSTSVFGRDAKRAGLKEVTERLDDWLNGSVFPLKLSGAGAPSDDHIRRVAATFAGDDIGEKGWQLHLDFQAYDFSYIPIETLSMIYEQFLHAPVIKDKETTDAELTKGEKAGAYYTPIPVVNFMLAELEERQPLREGMRVCDPSCGSGAFLVQCYRRLIEKTYPATGSNPAPGNLRTLLQKSIFGVDYDGDACSVTELSLILTLLDYVDPPDLEEGNGPRFKLPTLRGENIFEENFFRQKPALVEVLGHKRFDWVVGNPPWNRLNPKKLDAEERKAWHWMETRGKDCPIGGNQIAQAFLWESPKLLKPTGECALLVPAIGLFEDPSREFRSTFFRQHRVHTVANFSNLAEVLFAGRSRVPAAALFYSPRPEGETPDTDETITTFSPLVANQEATRPPEPGTRNESWNLIINGNEIRELPTVEVLGGSGLPWKIATWGSRADTQLLARLARKWPSLEKLEAPWDRKNRKFKDDAPHYLFGISEGLQLRPGGGGEATERVDEVREQELLDVDALKKLRHIFAFPKAALTPLGKGPHFARVRGGVHLPLAVCRPPHVIVSESRFFAVFCNKFVVVPPRQIGIVSLAKDVALLKTMSLYLSSDFAFYHQFLLSPHFGVKRDVATLAALRQIPFPFSDVEKADLSDWVELHAELAKTKPRHLYASSDEAQGELSLADAEDAGGNQEELLARLNQMVGNALGLDESERTIVRDLVHIRCELRDGKVREVAGRTSTSREMESYARRLKQELDDFTGEDSDRLHCVCVVFDDHSGMVEVDFTRDHAAARKVSVLSAEHEEAKAFRRTREKLLQPWSQWVYFDRSLRLYERRKTYLFKPRQRFHWTESQAMMDAERIIAETLSSPAQGSA
jgi:hypothetical protein